MGAQPDHLSPWEAKAGGSEAQGQLGLQSERKPDYMHGIHQSGHQHPWEEHNSSLALVNEQLGSLTATLESISTIDLSY